ncbi:MAG TPA: alpha/beta fold hydrolase [Streptosporangiaceae bacterium]|nr:alpha/beta fold hydrolase [Streptosporangiaceae bacterium]
MPQNPEPDSRDEIRTVRALGHDLRVSIRPGTDPVAPPLLMLMGIGGNIEMWEPLRSTLTERVGMTTVAFDVPGTGESPPPLFPLPLPGLALLTSRLLRILELDRVDVLGLSWGGLLAQQLALTASRQVHRLVLASTSVGLGSIPGGWSALRALATPARYQSMGQLNDALDVFGGNADDYASDAMRIHNQARLARPPSICGYYGQIASLAGWTSLPWLPLIRQPALVLCGSADQAVPAINSRVLATLLPHAELEILRGGGHLVLFEQLAASVDLLAKFLGTPPDESKL